MGETRHILQKPSLSVRETFESMSGMESRLKTVVRVSRKQWPYNALGRVD